MQSQDSLYPENQVMPSSTDEDIDSLVSLKVTYTPVKVATPTVIAQEKINIDELELEPAGCRKPGDDYSRIWIRGYVMNQRTYEMLEYADSLYGGEIDITNLAITQGSFSDNGSASFGTHLGGGAVDLSVRSIEDYSILYQEIEPLVTALRTAGFAAWLRDNDEVYQGTGIHIHAIAIGDEQLSYPAQEQLTGKFGYFRGYNGIPNEDGLLIPDRHSGPLLCDWMLDMGYEDMRPADTRASYIDKESTNTWQEDLRQVAMSYVTTTADETALLASEIDFLPGSQEKPEGLRAPLAAEILIRSGLISDELSPAGNIRNYQTKLLVTEDILWQLFSTYDFSIERFSEPAAGFDFSTIQLLAGDLIVAYGESGTVPDLFVVTDIDHEGRVFTVTPVEVGVDEFIVRHEILFDQFDPAASIFMRDNQQKQPVGRRGFDIIRRKGVTLPAGSAYRYIVRPGDTVRMIADEFHSSIASIISENQGIDIEHLIVGQELTVIIGSILSE